MSKKLTEYPTPVGQQMSGTAAKQTAATRSVTQQVPSDIKKASPSPTTTVQKAPKNMTGAVKARDLKMNQQYTDAKGNQISVVSPYMQGRNKESIVVQDQKTKEYFTINPNDMLGETLDDILDRKKHNFAKKISRKQNKLKQLIRAAKFGNTYDDPLFEIDFNSKEIIQNALDAPIQCGFEAETTWPDLDTTSDEPADLYGRDWSEIEEYIYDQEGVRGIDRVKNLYNDWLIQEVASDIEREIIDDLVRDRKEDEAYLDDYISDQIDMDDVEEYKQDYLEDLENTAGQDDMFDTDAQERAQEELSEREDWDIDAWAREYVEENYQDEFVEWLEEQIRDNGEAWDDAVQQAEETYDIDDWAQKEYSNNWYSLLDDANVQIWVPDEDGANNLDEVASNMEDWASNNSKSNDVRLGSYHSGKGVDNTYWRVEDDSSIEGEGAKAEIISPVYNTPREMLAEMKMLFEHFEDEGVETNSTTGLHVTMSFAGDYKETNRLVLATLLGDQYVLKQFNRQFNSYAKSQQQNIQYEIERMMRDGGSPEDFDELYSILSRGIDPGKFNSINFKGGTKNSDGNSLIEFRIAGGNDYHTDYDKAAKAVIRYAATMNAASEDKPYNRKDFLKTVYRMVNKGADDKLAPTRTDVNISLPDNDFVQAVRQVLNQTGDRLDAVETLDRAYKELANGDGVLAKKHFTEFMKSLLVSVKNREKVGGGFKLKPTSLLVRGFKQGMKEFGVSRDEIARAVSQHYINNADHIVNTTDLDIHDDFIVPTVAVLDQILLKKGQPAPERGPSLGIPYVQDARTYIRRSAYAGQSQYDDNAPVDIDKDVKFVNNDDHSEIDKLISARNVLTDHPDLKNPNPELAADIQQKLEKVNTELSKYEQKYGIKFASQYPPAGQEMDAFSHASSTDPVWQRHLRSKGIHLYQAEGKIFDRFDKLSLQEQLALLAKVDKRKIDEAWSKKYKDSINCDNPKGFSQKAHCAGKKKKTEARKKMSAQDRLWKSYNAYTKKMTGKTADERAKELELKIAQMKKDRDAHVANEAEEPKDASARAKLDHSLRAQGHKVEKPKKGKGSFKRTEKHKGKLPESTDFRKGDRVKHAQTGEKGTVLHKGNRDQVVVKFGSLNKSLSANQLRLVNDIEEADQVKTKERKPKIVKPNTGHQSKHPYQGRLVGEGAVPETNMPDEFKQIMSRPLLGSDLKGQMRAFEIVPDPAMIREFRSQISMSGKDVDLRDTFKSFASAKLHPVQKKQVGLAESVLMEKGLSLGDIGKRNNFTVFKQKISSSSPFAATDGAEVIIAPTFARKIKTIDDLKQFVQGRQVMLPLKNEPGYVVPLSYLLKTAEFGGTAKKETGVANRGELAEGVLGAATFARIAKRPGKPITYDEVLKVIQSLPKTDTGGSISKNVKTSGVTDKITLTVRLGANTYADLIDTQKLTSDALMNSYIKSTVQFVNDYTRLYANFFEQNGRPDEVEIVSDGVSENTDRKTDVYMIYVDEAGNRQLKHFDISLKAGTVKQFGQVGYGRSTSPIENRFAKVMELFTQFGVNQNSFTFRPEQFQDDDGVALIKDLYKQAVELINQKLMGSDPATEYEYLDQIAQGVTYFATSNDPTVKLLQLDKGRYYVLDFKKLRPKLDGIDLEAQYAETSSGDPIVRIHDKNNPKNSGRLLQIRTKQDSNGYIRQILEKEPLLKKLISVRHVGDIER